ncbi:hypothetical protein ATZ36_06250 [Candidatus Endomicrobiellum trichonymphae]|uniref:Lipoprotein n=1 Tax=Endomicrobium trichonymphae TaxID=1408204 RepID=A0A1E5IIY7_ENDTX|nr:hypothetical protein ATZ36_06250 [Candidatus Endomicrobium trichonymphae]
MKKTLVFVLVFMLAFTGCTKFREIMNGGHNKSEIKQEERNGMGLSNTDLLFFGTIAFTVSVIVFLGLRSESRKQVN